MAETWRDKAIPVQVKEPAPSAWREKAVPVKVAEEAAKIASIDPVDEITRIASTINEKWLAPALGGIPDAVGNAIYWPVNEIFGTDYRSDLTGVIREGMRDIGASGGPDYKPQTETGQIAADVVGGAAAVLPMMMTGGAAGAGMAPGVGKNVAGLLTANPGVQIASGAGAGAGSYAANEIAPGNNFAQLLGMLGGGILGGGLAYKPTADDMAVVDAFNRQKVPPTVGAVSGPGMQKFESSGLGTTLGGAGLVQKAHNNMVNSVGERLGKVARGVGTAQSADDLGNTLQASVGRYMDDTATQANSMFSRIGSIFSPQDKFAAKNTLATLGKSFDNIDDPAIAALVRDPRFNTYRQALADAGDELSYNTMQGFRSYIGRQMDRLLLDGGADNAQLKALYGALTQDMKDALVARGGTKALQMFDDANAWYTNRMETARNNLQPLIGKNQPVPAEKAFRTLEQSTSATTGNIQRLKDIYGALTPAERKDFTASFIERMGQGPNGFSVDRFLSDLGKMSPEAKRVVFTDQFGDDLLRAWDDLTQVIMPQVKSLTGNRNFSNSGLSIMQGGQLLGAASTLANPLQAAMIALGPWAAARAMTYPAAVSTIVNMLKRGETAAAIAARVNAILQAAQAGKD